MKGRGVDQASTNANNTSTMFDALGRVTGVTNALGSFAYAYVDQTSRLASVTYPGSTGLVTNYSYFNNVGDQRLQEIKNLKSVANMSDFQYTYNPVGTIASWKQQTDANTPTQYALSYDNADQLTDAEQTLTSSGTTVTSNKYNYDPAGNRLLETTLRGTTGGQFNKLNQLTALGTAGSQSISGNTSAPISSLTVNAVPASISNSTNFSANVSLPNGTNALSLVAQPVSSSTPVTTQRFQIVTGGTLPTQLTYDANGNCTQDENGNKYIWDALNRLTRITYPSTAYTAFAYDGLSRRTQIAEYDSSHALTSTKNYLWIGSEIAEERDASNAVTKRFFPQGEQQSGTPYYYSRDHLGSVREMLNSSGTIVARYGYDPYGKTTLVSGSNLATFQYAGYYQHQASGLSLTLFRAYDSNMARWPSRGPMGEKGGLNLYDYVSDDPANVIDPLGLYSCKEICAEIRTVKNAMKTLLDMAKTGKSLKQENATVRGNPLMGGDTPLSNDFEHQVPGDIRDVLLLIGMETLGRAVGDVTATTPVNFWSLYAMTDIYREQQFLDQLNCMAQKQGCNCGNSSK